MKPQNPHRNFAHKQLGYLGIGPRRVMGSMNARRRLEALLDSSAFYAPRTSSIIQSRGSGTPTITRATVATVMGYAAAATLADGQTLLTVASGELRHQGARRSSEGVWSTVDANGVPIPAGELDGSVVEAAATNLCLQSQTLGTAPWSGDNATVGTENSAVAPDGTMTMDEVVPSLTSYSSGIRQDISVTDTGTYTFSAYVYSSTGDTFKVRIRFFNTGTILDVDSDAVVLAAGETRRITVTGTNNGTGNTLGRVSVRSLTTAAYHQWGAQVELGSYATAYIPTTTAAVTRNKDVLDDQVSGNLTAAAGSVAFQWTPSHDPSGTIALAGSYVDASNYTVLLAQKVTNLILGSSDDITVSPWGLNGVPTEVTASSITFAATTTNGVVNQGITAAATGAQVFIIKCEAWTDSGTKQFRLQITKPSVANYTSGDFTATTTPTVFYYVATTAAGAASTDAYLINSSDASTGKVNFSEIVVEDVTNNISQFPAPYVSTATGSATFAIFRKVIAATAYDAYLAHAYVSGTTYDVSLRWGASGSQIAVDGVLGTAHANTTAAQLGTRWQWGSDGNGGQQAGAAIKEMRLFTKAISNAELVAMTI